MSKELDNLHRKMVRIGIDPFTGGALQKESYMSTVKEKELARLRNEDGWPADYIHVKTWPEIKPQRFGILYKGTFRVGVFKILGPPEFEAGPEQFASYEELVERWMGD